jgi:hypothetical protein
MPEGIVLAKGSSRSGKPTITVDGQLYYVGKNADISSVGVGDKISFESNSSVFKDTTYWYLNSCKVLVPISKMPPVGSAHLVSPAAPKASNAVPEVTFPSSSWAVQDAERPCVSNWGAELIKAGLWKNPDDMDAWIMRIKNALR